MRFAGSDPFKREMGVFWKAKIKFFKIFLKENKKTERILNSVASSNPFGCKKSIYCFWKLPFSVVRVLRWRKIDFGSMKNRKSDRCKKRRYRLLFLLCRVDGGDQNTFYFNTSVKNRFVIIISAFNQKFKPIFRFGAFLEGNM